MTISIKLMPAGPILCWSSLRSDRIKNVSRKVSFSGVWKFSVGFEFNKCFALAVDNRSAALWKWFLCAGCRTDVGAGSCAIRCKRFRPSRGRLRVTLSGTGGVYLAFLGRAQRTHLYTPGRRLLIRSFVMPRWTTHAPNARRPPQIYAPPRALMQRKIHFCRHKFTPRCARVRERAAGFIYTFACCERWTSATCCCRTGKIHNTVGMKRKFYYPCKIARRTKMKCACD